ncbi:hypothetical protein ACHAXT_004822 [Thalassiosira profunda]
MAKADVANPHRRAIDTANDPTRPAKPIPILHRGRALGYALGTSARALVRQFLQPVRPAVSFSSKPAAVHRYSRLEPAVTYDSGADAHYLAKRDRTSAHLPILRKSSKRVRSANGGVSQQPVTKLPFERLSTTAAEAHEFPDFPDSL